MSTIMPTQIGLIKGLLLLNWLLSIVCSEWILGDYDYPDGGGYYGDGSGAPTGYQRSYYGYNNYRPSYAYGGHSSGGYGNNRENSNSGYHIPKETGHPSHKNKGYGYEKHDYKYEKEYYGGHDGYNRQGDESEHYRKENHRDKGYGSKKHQYESKESGYGHEDHGHDEKKAASYGHSSDGYGDEAGDHGKHGAGYGSGKSHGNALYGYCHNDFDCPMSQCCLKQNGVNMCTDLNANTGACSRRRECRHQQDCPSSQCCFPRNPNVLALRYAAGYNYRNYASGYGGYGNRYLHMDGVCQPAGMRGQPCMMLLQGVTARGCPCTTGLTCNIPSGSNAGTCQ